MHKDFVVCANRAGWVLKVCGAVTAILEFESRDEAMSFGNAIAVRKGVDLVLEEQSSSLPLAA
ncbi:DUF2188 domain-containing protein [Cupriavidus sp. 2TAF22]|uniref:DUF2188 domain-containing protein n=1 Tax=unclassified Cupriavidus TaxID=2640874 RepID=UPI003F8DD7B5